jgi:DNA-binding GntR family transcriptional regulator
MTRPGTFERVYGALKLRLREGAFKPGDRLEPAVLSQQLNASVTPVRDALHRLTGERLVEAPRQEGFRAPMLTEAILRHLYAWHLDLLLLAVTKQRALSLKDPNEAGDPSAQHSLRERQNAIFLELVRASGNSEHMMALEALGERLEPIQRIEDRLLDALESETMEISAAIRSGNRNSLRRSLVKYHRRRERIVPELLAMLKED